MSGYWDRRFLEEGRIWGDAPSRTAGIAEAAFRKARVRKILVPGAGYGRNAEYFSEAGYEVTGVEISREALKLARPGSAVRYVQGSVLDMDLPRDGFDALYCFNVLHLFPSDGRRRFLSRCLQALKPGGMAFFAVFSDAEPHTSKPGRPVHYFTDNDLRNNIAGFEALESGVTRDPESHGAEGPHEHILRYILARKRASDFDGVKYAEASRHQKEWGRRIVAELELSGNERVLDLGCGDGALTAEIARLVPRGTVLGIDSSPGMIDAARRVQGGNLSVELMDIDALDFDGRFDVIFSNATLHWVKDHRRLLLNCRRALAGNGRLRFNFGGRGNCARFISVVSEAMESGRFSAYFRDFDWPWYMPGADDYERLARESGAFGLVRVWEENADRVFTKDELIRWIDQPSIVPFLAPLPEDEREAFKGAVREKMLEITLRSAGGHFETFRRINLIARPSPP
jgi:trans-aconitate 2-methyltransferase